VVEPTPCRQLLKHRAQRAKQNEVYNKIDTIYKQGYVCLAEGGRYATLIRRAPH